MQRILFVFAVLTGAWLCGDSASAQNWYGGYYHTSWNQPVALVTPPTVRWQSHYNWGVSNTRMTPIYSQFGPTAPGFGGVRLRPTPRWPSSTDHFGVYHVRAPW